MDVCENRGKCEEFAQVLQKHLLVSVEGHKSKESAHLAKPPLDSNATVTHHRVECLPLRSGDLPSAKRSEQSGSSPIPTITVQSQLSPVAVMQRLDKCVQSTLSVHHCIISTTVTGPEAVRNQPIWHHDMLIFETVVTFVSTEKVSLTKFGLACSTHCPINKPPHIVQCRPFLEYSMCEFLMPDS